MQSIEEAWAELDRATQRVGMSPGMRELAITETVAKAAARALALTVHWEMVAIIRPLAPLAGKVNIAAVERANDLGVELRARIKALN